MTEIIRLKNGMRMVFEELPHLKSASIGIWVRAGSINEQKKNMGISHLIEHMMFKGTENRTAKEIATNVDKIGGQINAFTGKEATCYYIKTVSDKIDAACDILADMFLNSQFDKELMKREKQVIYEEMKMSNDDPDDVAHDMLCETIFKEHPLGKSIIGTKSSLSGITRNMIMEYIEKEYTLDSIVISVSGAFNKEKVAAFFEERFAALKPHKNAFTPVKFNYNRGYKTKVKDVEQSHIFLGLPTISIKDDRYYAFAIMNTLMGGSMGSRLFQNIREEKGLAYSVYSMQAAYQDTGYYMIYAGVADDKIKDVISAVKEELGRLKLDGVSADEMEAARQQIRSSYIYSQENTNSRMMANGKNLLLLDKVFEAEEVVAAIDEVNLDNMREVADMIGDMDMYSASLVTGKKISLSNIMRGV